MNKLLGCLLACASIATAGTAFAVSPASPAVATVPRQVAVDFGDIVQQGFPDESLQLAFAGRRGQLIALQTDVYEDSPQGCESVELRRGDEEIVQTAAHVWRLPSDGRYEVDYSQTCINPFSNYADRLIVSAVLSRVAVTPARVGERLHLGMGRAVIRAASVRLGERPVLFSGASVLPASALRTTVDRAVRLRRDCFPETLSPDRVPAPEDRLYGGRCGFRARAGDRYLVFGDDATRVQPYAVSRGVLDGRSIPIGDDPHQIVFSGRAGDVVYHEWKHIRLAAESGDGVWLVNGANSSRVDALQLSFREGRLELAWVLPRTGTYQLRVARHVARPKASIRLRTARLTQIPIGEDVDVPVGPGRWTFAVVEAERNGALEGVVRATSHLVEGWQARLMSATDGHWSSGGPPPLREVGARTVPVFGLLGVLLKPGAGQRGTGSVRLRLNACPYDPSAGKLVCTES